MNGRRAQIILHAVIAALALALLLAAFAVPSSPIGADSPVASTAAESSAIPGEGAGAPPAADPEVSYKGPFGFGRDATSEEIAAWDIDVRPDGAGLPPSSGTVAQGAAIYAQLCAPCHGLTGKEGPMDVLVKPFEDGAAWPQFPRTIGNYWPYAATVYDYVNRAMPFSSPNSLGDDEVYALTAWLLNQNRIVPDDAVMNAETLPKVQMPAQGSFRPEEPRPSLP